METVVEKESYLWETRLVVTGFYDNYSTEIKNHRHDYIELLYLASGKVVVTVNHEPFELLSGDIVVINSRESHAIEYQADACLVAVQFKPLSIIPDCSRHGGSTYLLPGLQNKLVCRRHIRLSGDVELKEVLEEVCNDLLVLYAGSESNARKNISKLFSWLAKRGFIAILPKGAFCAVEAAKLSILLSYLKDHFSERITVAEASAMVFMSVSHFCRVFKKIIGKSFIEYVNCLRLYEAEKLVVETQKSISEIAQEVGFSTSSYFIRLFTKENGISPVIYRKQNCPKAVYII